MEATEGKRVTCAIEERVDGKKVTGKEDDERRGEKQRRHMEVQKE